MTDYIKAITTKYPDAIPEVNFSLQIVPDPEQMLPITYDEEGNPIFPDNSNCPMIAEFTFWALPYPQPTIVELDAYALTAPYLALVLAKAKVFASNTVNEMANTEVLRRGILTGQIFVSANVADVGFMVTAWRAEGKPLVPDSVVYYRAYTEALAYREVSDPTMTPYKMLLTWETQWLGMRNAFAQLNYSRRRALELIKVATDVEGINAAIADINWAVTIPTV